MSTGTQSATKYAPLTEPIRSAQVLADRMAAIQDVAIVLSPLTGVSDIPAGWRVSERYVFMQWEEVPYKDRSGIEKTSLRGDVYKASWCSGDHVAPSSQGLNRIWGAAGGSIIYLKRVDDRKDPCVCEVEGQLELRQIDSNLQRIPADKRLDYTSKSEAAKAMTERQLPQARQRIHELTMTEAFSRGIRKALAMAQSYSMAALKEKPFVVYACVPDFDMSDKMTRAMVVASQLGCVEQLFGAAGARQLMLGPGQPQGPTSQTANGTTVDAATGEVVENGEDDFTPPPAAAAAQAQSTPEAACECEHGCQAPITAEVAEKTQAITGRKLCKACFPGAGFDYSLHAQLTSLKLSKYPDMTPAKAHEWAQKLRKGA